VDKELVFRMSIGSEFQTFGEDLLYFSLLMARESKTGLKLGVGF